MILAGLGAYFTLRNPQEARAAWYNSSWLYRKEIIIQAAQVGAGGVANFPVVVNLASDTQLKNNALSTGYDILFADKDGSTKIAHEIERYVSATGELVAWVRIPFVNSTSTTSFFMYYGNSSAGDQSNAAGVWDANYKGVWHLSDSAGTNISESTGNPNAGTKLTASEPSATSTSKIGGGQIFDGNNDVITVADDDSLDITSNLTVEAWVNAIDWPNAYSGAVIDKEGNFYLRSGDTAATDLDMGWWDDVGGNGNIRVSRAAPPAAGGWHHVVGVAQNNDAYEVYVDGVDVGGAPYNWFCCTPRFLTDPLYIGGSADPGFHGTIDEVRVSNSVRTVAWIQTEYNNQSAPSSFYQLQGTEAESPSPAAVKIRGGVKARGGVKFRFDEFLLSTAMKILRHTALSRLQE